MAVAVEIPFTATGILKVIFVPFPSWPLELRPQHPTEPPLKTAQVWEYPAAIAVAVEIPLTATGTLELIFVAFPSWPVVLSPQHRTEPPLKTAQVWEPPAAMAIGSAELVDSKEKAKKRLINIDLKFTRFSVMTKPFRNILLMVFSLFY